MKFRRMQNDQRGLALITAVLVMVIVFTISIYLMLGQQVWIRQTQNLSDRNQFESMRRAVMDFVGLLGTQNAKDLTTGSSDALKKANMLLKETSLTGINLTEVEHGGFDVFVEDAQARFNVNNVVKSGQPSPGDIAAFKKLLMLLDVDQNLASNVVDWISVGGNKDTDYLSQATPYRTSGQPLVSIEELRLIKG